MPILEIRRASQVTHLVKNLHANVGDTVDAEDAGEVGLVSRLGISLEEGMQPIPIFLPGESMYKGARQSIVHRATER